MSAFTDEVTSSKAAAQALVSASTVLGSEDITTINDQLATHFDAITNAYNNHSGVETQLGMARNQIIYMKDFVASGVDAAGITWDGKEKERTIEELQRFLFRLIALSGGIAV